MALIKCKECKKSVYAVAEKCPHCAAPYPGSYIPSKIILHRKPAFVGTLGTLLVDLDGKKVGGLKSDKEITFDLFQGRHTIKTYFKFGLSRLYTFDVLPASIYKIDLWAKVGGIEYQAKRKDA